MSIRYKLLLAMSAIVLLAVCSAVYALGLVTSSSALVVRLYDGPLMAINHGRSAQFNFAEARHDVERAVVMREAARPENLAKIEKTLKQFAADLGIVRERMANADTFNTQLDKVLTLVDAWHKKSMNYLRPPAAGVTELLLPESIVKDGRSIGEAIDNIVENISAHGFDFRTDAEAAASTSKITMIGLAIATVLAGLILALGMASSLTKPLRALARPLEEIAHGNFSVEVPGVGRKDEVGRIAEAVNEMVQRVRSTLGEIRDSAREVTNASAEISSSTTDLSQRTEEQAASLEETSASMEEMSQTVKKNAANAQHASDAAGNTRHVADRGGAVVAKAVGAMAKIEDSSRKITDIIGVIDEIARQTNLLAHNAGVDAARAGEAGRGFAVVASEVRSLAQRSSQAAKDINGLITNSTSQVKDGVELVNQAGTALTEIVDSIKTVASIIDDIASASAEQARGLDEINRAINQMDEVTQQNSALVEENAATAKMLENQAKAMDEQVSYFKVEADVDEEEVEAQEEAAQPVRETRRPLRGPAARVAKAA